MKGDQIQYSEKYNDDKYEYRHVILPTDLAKLVPKTHLMTETEWRNLESSSPLAGYTTWSTVQSHTSCCSEDPGRMYS